MGEPNMSDEKKSESAKRAEKQEKDILSSVQDENKRIQAAAEKAREDSGHGEGETEEEYNYRIANVPGIFGDTDTTAGSGASGMDVVSANNEQATAVAAAVEADPDNDASHDKARRQSDIAADGAPSAEEADAAAPNKDVVSANNEQATAVAAAVEADPDNDASHDKARRQSDIAADGAPSAEEADAAAPNKDDDNKDGDKDDEKKSPLPRPRNTRK